ncbi:MAG TPA: cytochrome c biogenesis protein CcsA [bacterium]|nr:cytochrome c biogenesis protein CcsA [bacterium]
MKGLDILLGLAVAAYGLGAAQAFRYLAYLDPALEASAFRWLTWGIGLQAVFLAALGGSQGYTPVTNLSEILSVLAFSLGVALALGRSKVSAPLLSVLFLPFIFLLSVFSLVAAAKGQGPMSSLLTEPLIALHIFLTLLGYSFFTLGFGVGVTYWLQESQIKRHQLRKWANHLPALDSLEGLTVFFTGWGFLLWAAGLFMGIFQALKVWGGIPCSDPKILGSFSVLLIYAAFFLGRWGLGLRGKKTMVLVLAGYFLALFTFLGVQVFLNSRHVY